MHKNIGLSLTVDEGLLSEEPLLVQVWSKRASPLPDYLIGESRARLDALISAGGEATPTTFELGRPGHRQQGVLSCSLCFEQQTEPVHCAAGRHRRLNATSRDHAGAVGLAVTINHDAEAATAAFICANIAQLERHEWLRIEREAAAVAAANNRLDVASGKIESTEKKQISAVNTTLQPSRLYHSNATDLQSGVDSVTGLPWRTDDGGYRRFFLGLAAEDFRPF